MRALAYEFAAEVDRRIKALSAKAFYTHQGDAKTLIEEWYPIARLALHLQRPGLEVDVEAFGGNDAADGHIVVRGLADGEERAFDIQVTYLHDHDEALRDELLAKQGFAPGAGPIARNKKSGAIEATLGAVDHDHNLRRAAIGIAERFKAKAAKSYSAGTVLVIAFDDMTISGRNHWQQLLAFVDEQASLINSRFRSIYLLNIATNELMQIA